VVVQIGFCTPKYLITRELYMDKLKIGWGIRTRRYEIKVKRREGWRNSKVVLRGERGRRMERDLRERDGKVL